MNQDGQPLKRRFNQAQRAERDISEVLGLVKGMLADGEVSEGEAILLRDWIASHPDAATQWPVRPICERLTKIFADGRVDLEEREDLADLLRSLVGEEAGMLAGLDVMAQFDRVTDYWSPKVIAQVNDQYVKVAKLKGQLTWHSHAGEDELFWILRGRLRIEFRDRVVDLEPGQCFVVPRGVEHNPVAEDECWIVLIEPVTTEHTGDVQMERTRSIEEQLS